MPFKAIVLNFLWSLRSNLNGTAWFLARALATGMSYFGGGWTVLLVGVLLFAGEAVKRLWSKPAADTVPPRREDEGR